MTWDIRRFSSILQDLVATGREGAKVSLIIMGPQLEVAQNLGETIKFTTIESIKA